MTEFEIPKPPLDLKWEFEYGEDQGIQTIEKEIFNYDKEVGPILNNIVQQLLSEAHLEVQFELREELYEQTLKSLQQQEQQKK